MQKPRIVIIFTGGTIASTLDREWGGVVPSLSGGEILSHLPDVYDHADIVIHEYGTFPGPHITPERMLEIATVIRTYVQRDDIDGVVVTHGTDTLEETAYFLDSSVETPKPIVVIGAMRNSSEADWDGPRNLRDAITVASHVHSRNLGALVCLGGDIHAASEVTKEDTADVSTFSSPNFGPLGRVTNKHVLIHRSPIHRETFPVTAIPGAVPLFKSYAGMDGSLIAAACEKGAVGIVIEAFGVGNVTPPAFTALTNAVNAGLPVVLVSRCPVGRVEHVYAYDGAGLHLYRSGVIFADYLNGPKARIKLICALGAGRDLAAVRRAFEWVDDQEAAAT
jgi:L-asparaginase